MLTKHGYSFLPTTSSPSHHHQPCSSLLPTMLVTTTAFHDCPQMPTATNDHSTTMTGQKMKTATHKLQLTPTPQTTAWTHKWIQAVTSPGESTCLSSPFISFIWNTGGVLYPHPQIPCGLHLDSIWKRPQSTILYKIHLDSRWTPLLV